MRSPQLLIYENGDRLAGLVREQAKQQQWTLRSPRSVESCLRLVEPGGPTVIVLELGLHVPAEMRLLEQCSQRVPDVPVLVVSDSDNAQLTGIAWDLGARFVFCPPQQREQLPEIIAGLMEAAIGRPRPVPSPGGPASSGGGA